MTSSSQPMSVYIEQKVSNLYLKQIQERRFDHLVEREMRQMLAVMRRNLQNMRKSHRVADESMFGDGDGNGAGDLPIFVRGMNRRQSGWNGISIIHGVIRAPLSLLSCLSHPHTINVADGAWASSELALISEMNQLMVNDSLRYAILM